MQFKLALVALFSASAAMAATVTAFAGAGCTGTKGESLNINSGDIGSGICLTLGGKSISYSGVPNFIEFYESGGAHDFCNDGSQLTLGAGSGCGTAPNGFNWESVAVF